VPHLKVSKTDAAQSQTGNLAYPSATNGHANEKQCSYLLFIVLAQHREERKFCGLRQELIVALKPCLLVRQFQMNIEILASSPILVEEKYIGIIVADVKMIVDAAGFGPRPINKAAQKFKELCTFFWSGVQSSCEGATWFHIFLRLLFDHAESVHAIWFFRLECDSGVNAALVEAPRFGIGERQLLEGIFSE
jgi:hypothetical protein